jgi:hypothetical protein
VPIKFWSKEIERTAFVSVFVYLKLDVRLSR